MTIQILQNFVIFSFLQVLWIFTKGPENRNGGNFFSLSDAYRLVSWLKMTIIHIHEKLKSDMVPTYPPKSESPIFDLVG